MVDIIQEEFDQLLLFGMNRGLERSSQLLVG
jgi:hypothetical protein